MTILHIRHRHDASPPVKTGRHPTGIAESTSDTPEALGTPFVVCRHTHDPITRPHAHWVFIEDEHGAAHLEARWHTDP